ncbi:hypothetical protein [Nocardia sp. NBC_01327]|uniref:hypothetical protein n=1 Tax=Nocardia sp. NBC_01327 TaxID=2903593 RepID=UPI002E1030DD|nr:hypothetical protein OG326_30235 [Nocardia sp. NBC_01327]
MAGSDLMVAQSLGGRELTVVVRRAEPVPGPLRVDIVTHTGSAAGTLGLSVTPSDRGGDGASGTVVLGDRAGVYSATLRVDHAGPWELAVKDGDQVARIPFLVAATVVTPWERAAYGGFFGAGVLLLVSIGTAMVSKRGWPTLVPAGVMIAALAVGITGATLSASAPLPRPAGSLLDPTSDTIGDPFPERQLPLTTNYSRPPVNLTLTTTGAAETSHPTELMLSLTDAATGRPVDDLLVNDDALLHLMIVGPNGSFWHRHPIRTAPGEYRIRLALNQSGDYGVAAEIARRGGGVQLLRSTLHVSGESAPVAAPDSGGAELTPTALVAGEPGTLTAHFGGASDLQPWLGMVGHLIAVGPLPDQAPTGAAAAAAPIWAHAHAMAPMLGPGAQLPDETVAAYSPDVSFTFTFPLPGRYLVWAQAERGYSLMTVPATVDVRAKESQ